MSRLVRLFSVDSTIHAFGRLRADRGRLSCRDKANLAARATAPVLVSRDSDVTPSHQSMNAGAVVARTAALRPTVQAVAAATPRPTVRVYRRTSGMTMVGNIDAICRMIDRCIADERAALAPRGGLVAVATLAAG